MGGGGVLAIVVSWWRSIRPRQSNDSSGSSGVSDSRSTNIGRRSNANVFVPKKERLLFATRCLIPVVLHHFGAHVFRTSIRNAQFTAVSSLQGLENRTGKKLPQKAEKNC